MCCFWSVLVLFGPRLAIMIWWFIRPGYYAVVFNSFFAAILGMVFLPWTTLMYLIVYGANGIVGFDYAWLAMAILMDIASYGGSAYGNRKKVSGYIVEESK